jgi:hypothetical protein
VLEHSVDLGAAQGGNGGRRKPPMGSKLALIGLADENALLAFADTIPLGLGAVIDAGFPGVGRFLQMGYTRARRYANYRGGKKYDKENGYKLRERGTGDPRKARSATTFRELWQKAEAEPRYARRKKEWKERLG